MHLLFGTLAALGVAGAARAVHNGRKAMGGKPRGDRLERIRTSPNHDGRTFVNNIRTSLAPRQGQAVDMLNRWLRGKEIRVPEEELPVHRLRPSELEKPPASGLRVTWMGHACTLIEIDGARVLTDPVWSKRVSPTAYVGPARFQPVPIPLSELPELDAVVISHDHYDHLDHQTIATLARAGMPFVVPLGVGAHLSRWGIADARIIELDWWERATIDTGIGAGIEFVATPARHFSGRSIGDRNKTLWASWVIRGPRHRVYFGGDSGMFPGFSDIGEREGPFDATLMPIGAYNEAWRAVHLDPEEAVQAHRMVRGGVLIPIHWGTFNLAFHDWFEPPERLLTAAASANVTIAMPLAGQPLEPENGSVVTPWWRACMHAAGDPADALA